MEIVINGCYGGFELSDLAYKELIKLGIPAIKYIKEKRGKDGKYIRTKENDGKIIFDRELTPLGENKLNDFYWERKRSKEKESSFNQRYWEVWISEERTNPLLIKVIKKLGKKANGYGAELKIIKIPDNIEYTIEEYDGIEHIAEVHKTWS